MTTHNHQLNYEEASIDLTPMLDVVFIMLIFFIVTASFVREVAIEIDRPGPNSTIIDSADGALVVIIGEDNQFWIEDRRIDVRSLRGVLERLHAQRPDQGLVIRASKVSKTHAMAAAADAARAAGILRVTVDNTER